MPEFVNPFVKNGDEIKEDPAAINKIEAAIEDKKKNIESAKATGLAATGSLVEKTKQNIDRPVQENKLLTSSKINNAKLAQIEAILKNGGMDSMSRVKAMDQIKEILS